MTTRKTPRPPRVGIARFNLELSPERLDRYKKAAEKAGKLKEKKEPKKGPDGKEKKKREHSLSAWVREVLNRESDKLLGD